MESIKSLTAPIVFSLLISGCCCPPRYVKDCPMSEKLVDVGEKGTTVRVLMNQKCNATGIRINEGDFYSFSTTTIAPIADGPIKCLRVEYKNENDCDDKIQPSGFTTRELPFLVKAVMWLGHRSRPLSDGSWLEVVGTVGRDDKDFFGVTRHPDGGEPYEASTTGELFLLANDYPYGDHYLNNEGEVLVTVRTVSPREKGGNRK